VSFWPALLCTLEIPAHAWSDLVLVIAKVEAFPGHCIFALVEPQSRSPAFSPANFSFQAWFMSLSTSRVPPTGAVIHQLVVKPVFDALPPREKLYAHYLARANWHGSRIVMRQVSPESPIIFDLILDLHRACAGDWKSLEARCNITPVELAAFLEYAATFLCNLGNFYVSLPGRSSRLSVLTAVYRGRAIRSSCQV
jgi:hypothetical protein